MTRARFAVLWRAFFAQFFASESVTSDQQLRYAMIGVLAFILAPCLLIMVELFPQFQLLVIRVGRMHPPPAVIVRATAVRNINAEDMIEWFVSILVAYSVDIGGKRPGEPPHQISLMPWLSKMAAACLAAAAVLSESASRAERASCVLARSTR